MKKKEVTNAYIRYIYRTIRTDEERIEANTMDEDNRSVQLDSLESISFALCQTTHSLETEA